MTKKRNLLLVSLFLVFGLATSALAQTQWTVGANENDYGRGQGLTEATGQVSIVNTSSSGTVGATTVIKITYSAPIVSLGTVYLVCSGSASPLSPFAVGQTYGGVGCGGLFTTALDTTSKVLALTFAHTVVFPVAASSQLSVTVRVDANVVKCGTDVTAQVDAHTPTGEPNFTITPFQPSSLLNVLKVNCDPALSLVLGTERGKLETEPAFVLTCIGAKDDFGPYDKDFTLNVDEEFPYALTSESYEISLDPGSADDVTNGTSFTIMFSNVPTGVGIANTDIKPCSTLWTGNPLSCPVGNTNLNVVLEPDQPVVSGNTVSFTFDTTSVDNGVAESVDLKFRFWSHGPLPPGLPSITANIEKVPTTPTTDIPLFVTDWELQNPLTVVTFIDCQTVLLYPYIVNGGGWDTGIAVSNTTLDPFAVPMPPNPLALAAWEYKGSAVPQTGPCTFYLFANGTTPWAATYTTPTIVPGSTAVLDMGANLKAGVAGYAIAVCDFQNAHGYALITYNLFGDNGIAANYIADVLPNPSLYHRTPAGDILGETAIAPYMINRALEKLLSYGSSKH